MDPADIALDQSWSHIVTLAAGLDLSVGGYPGITFSLGKDLMGASMAIEAGDYISMGTAAG